MKNGVPLPSWYLFNDFAVSPIEAIETVEYNPEWKMPAVLYFAERDIESNMDSDVNLPISIFEHRLLHVTSLSKTLKRPAHLPKTADELPKDGQLVAIDAEFVSLAKEEAEIRSGGHKSTVKPSRMACARISVVFGEGKHSGEPIFDDYITCAEPVCAAFCSLLFLLCVLFLSSHETTKQKMAAKGCGLPDSLFRHQA
eukprot:m.72470 g.72470  ORF g.72470 m.72470 type:complete len:198 (+) comp7995_c0_seq4:2784-3377(+)